MSTAPVAALLDEFAPLCHHDRMVRLVELGRRSVTDPSARTLIDELSHHPNAYGRLLALYSVYGSRSSVQVIAALGDPSRSVRRVARQLVARACDDSQAQTALAMTPPGRALVGLCFRLRGHKRTAVIDAFLAADPKRADLTDLIPIGSAAAFVAHAANFREMASVQAWARLATFHPEIAANELLTLIDTDPTLNPRSLYHVENTLDYLVKRSPDQALRVVAARLRQSGDPSASVVRKALALLAQRRPAETFDLLREVHERAQPTKPPGVFGLVNFRRRTERLGAARLAYLIQLGGSPLPDQAAGLHWFLRLSTADQDALVQVWLAEGKGSWGAFLLRRIPSDNNDLAQARETAFVRWREAAQLPNGSINVEALSWLPSDLRIREAYRHLESLPELATKPSERVLYGRLLPFAAAETALAPWLGHPEASERATAIAVLVETVRLEKQSLPAALLAAKARKFEQDPVRLAMMRALCHLPIGAFGPEHLDDVGQCIADALAAGDLSFPTSAAAEQLVVRLFRKDATWGATWLTKLLASRGTLSAAGLGDGLTDADVKALAPQLAELTGAWVTRERAGALLWLARSLKRRLRLVPDLVSAVELCAQEQPFVSVSSMALDILAHQVGIRFVEFVPKLLAADKSYALLPVVARFISYKRQDLLDPLLSFEKMKGRFATGNTSWVIHFEGGYRFWTDKQQATYAAGLLRVTGDEKRDVPALMSALETLVELAFIEPTDVIQLASDPRPPIRERAVRYLPRLDGGQGLRVLVECLGDDRARFAIYALRKSFSEMKPSDVVAILRNAPTRKVTVAKEVVRLMGTLPGEVAFLDLLSFDRPDLHRDVRIALLRALWTHLDKPEAWAILERAATDKDWVLASRLADIPSDQLSQTSQIRLAELLAQVLRRPEIEARLHLLGQAAYLPLPDKARSLFQACLARMAGPHPDESKAATRAVLQRMLPNEVEAVVARMWELAANRKLLWGFLSEVESRLSPYASAPIVALGRALLTHLTAEPRTTPEAVTLAGRLLGWEELSVLLNDLAIQDLLHVDAMMAAFAAIAHTAHPERLETTLMQHADARLRRLAVAALAIASGPNDGWSAERRKRLHTYRADMSPLVAAAAERVFPPADAETGA